MNTNIKNIRITLKSGDDQTKVIGSWHSNVKSVYIDEAVAIRAAKRLGCEVEDLKYRDSPAVVKVVKDSGSVSLLRYEVA